MPTDKNRFAFAGPLFCAALGVLVSMLAGCAADQAKVFFTDDGSLPQLAAGSVPPPFVKGLEKADIMQIEMQVFSQLLTRHFWDDGGYTAIFLQADDAEIATLQKKFSNHVPPIKPGYRADLRPDVSPMDKDTGKAAMILSVDVSEPEPDGSVPAIGKWYAGGAVTGFYSFIFKKIGDDWQIQNPP